MPGAACLSGCAGLAQEVDPHEAIELELDEEEDAPIIKWFYDDKPLLHTSHVNGPTYRRWKLPLPVMSTLYRLAGAALLFLLCMP